jgi:hypothetical protein
MQQNIFSITSHTADNVGWNFPTIGEFRCGAGFWTPKEGLFRKCGNVIPVKILWNLRFRCQFFRPTLPRVPRPQLRQFTRLSNSDIGVGQQREKVQINPFLNFFTLLTIFHKNERFFLLPLIQQNIFSITSHTAKGLKYSRDLGRKIWNGQSFFLGILSWIVIPVNSNSCVSKNIVRV